MAGDLPAYFAMWLVALAVLVLCGGGISYGYVSEGRWGQRRGETVRSTPQKADGFLPDRAVEGAVDHAVDHGHQERSQVAA